MNVSFCPELGQSLTIPISLAYTRTAELCFTATLDSQDHLQLQQVGAKVQLWSNFPVPGRTHGEWGEIDFADVPDSNPENAVSLLATTRDESAERSLYLKISIPFNDNTSKSYSYTYRIVYPAGETKWLGAFGQNGTITVQPTDEDQRISFLGDGWRRKPNTRVWESSKSAATQAVTIAKCLQREDWVVWSIGVESILTDTKDVSLLFLVPSVPNLAISSTLVLSASPGVAMAMTERGDITAVGSGSVLVSSCCADSDMNSFIQQISKFSSTQCRLLGDANSSIIVASPIESSPISVLVIPLLQSPPLTAYAAAIDWSNLAPSYVPSVEHPIALFSPPSNVIHFYESVVTAISLLIPPSGVKFVLCPLHSTRGKDITLQIAVLTAHVLFEQQDQSLPTPPPSPRLKPIDNAERSASSDAPPSAESDRASKPSTSSRGVLAVFKKVIVGLAFFLSLWLRRLFQRKHRKPAVQADVADVSERTPLLDQSASDPSRAIPEVPEARPLKSDLCFNLLESGDVVCIMREPSKTRSAELHHQSMFQLGTRQLKPLDFEALKEGVIRVNLGPVGTKNSLLRVFPAQ